MFGVRLTRIAKPTADNPPSTCDGFSESCPKRPISHPPPTGPSPRTAQGPPWQSQATTTSITGRRPSNRTAPNTFSNAAKPCYAFFLMMFVLFSLTKGFHPIVHISPFLFILFAQSFFPHPNSLYPYSLSSFLVSPSLIFLWFPFLSLASPFLLALLSHFLFILFPSSFPFSPYPFPCRLVADPPAADYSPR